MQDAIRNFAKQFEFNPKVENESRLVKAERFIVLGMGGSHFAADLIASACPEIDLLIHRDYGLPALPDAILKKSLIIASSYSGNTEEVIDGYGEAKKRRFPLAVVSIGGKLLDLARTDGVPYVQMPDTGIQPRSALGFSMKGILKLIGKESSVEELSRLAGSLNPTEYEERGKALAEKMKNFVPVIYSSSRNAGIAASWKIKFNETAKIPAFCNAFPELNHNEMTGFDAQDTTRALSKTFFFIFLKDQSDDERISKRMEITKKLFFDCGFPVEVVELEDDHVFKKIFSSLVLADWTAYYTGIGYGLEIEQVPMVEEFKKQMAE